MRVGWIGLGMMGLSMARRAQRAGHQVVGHTRNPDKHAALVEDGGTLERDLRAVVNNVDVLCINVFDDEQVRSILIDDDLLAHIPPPTVVAVHTTGDPAFIVDLRERAPAGVEITDAAFSGTTRQAEEGTLVMMVGGSMAAYERMVPLLQTYSEVVRHLGPAGRGRQLKLINNLLFAAHSKLAAETYGLANRLGFDTKVVCELLNRCSAASRGLEIIGANDRVAENLETMRFYLSKDISVAKRFAEMNAIDLGLLGDVASHLV